MALLFMIVLFYRRRKNNIAVDLLLETFVVIECASLGVFWKFCGQEKK